MSTAEKSNQRRKLRYRLGLTTGLRLADAPEQAQPLKARLPAIERALQDAAGKTVRGSVQVKDRFGPRIVSVDVEYPGQGGNELRQQLDSALKDVLRQHLHGLDGWMVVEPGKPKIPEKRPSVERLTSG